MEFNKSQKLKDVVFDEYSLDLNPYVQGPIFNPIFYPYYGFMIGRSKQSISESTYFGLGIQWK